jgi:hypothetical protein
MAILVVDKGTVGIAGGTVRDDLAAFVLNPDTEDAFEFPQHFLGRKRLALIEASHKHRAVWADFLTAQ